MKTNVEDRLLELIREKPMLVERLQEELPLSVEKTDAVLIFLRKQGLIESTPVLGGGIGVFITPKGLKLLESNDPPTELGTLPPEDPRIQRFMGEGAKGVDWWELVMKLKKPISGLFFDEGSITIEQRTDKFILTAIIPKEGELQLQKEDITKCHNISEEAKKEVREMRTRKLAGIVWKGV